VQTPSLKRLRKSRQQNPPSGTSTKLSLPFDVTPPTLNSILKPLPANINPVVTRHAEYSASILSHKRVPYAISYRRTRNSLPDSISHPPQAIGESSRTAICAELRLNNIGSLIVTCILRSRVGPEPATTSSISRLIFLTS
jgi:hypothetical protein